MTIREWVATSLVLGFLAFAAVTANFSLTRAKNILYKTPPPKKLTIFLTGAVQNPGEYECTPGISVKELLKKTDLKSSANRRKIPFKKILLSDQTIQIPEKTNARS